MQMGILTHPTLLFDFFGKLSPKRDYFRTQMANLRATFRNTFGKLSPKRDYYYFALKNSYLHLEIGLGFVFSPLIHLFEVTQAQLYCNYVPLVIFFFLLTFPFLHDLGECQIFRTSEATRKIVDIAALLVRSTGLFHIQPQVLLYFWISHCL